MSIQEKDFVDGNGSPVAAVLGGDTGVAVEEASVGTWL
jgi:hypothetical protein